MAETAPNRLYSVARRAMALEDFHWINNTFWLALLDAGYVADTIEHTLWSDVTPSARLVDAGPLGNKSVDDEGWCIAGPVTMARVRTNTPATQAVIYRKHVGSP